MVFDTAFALAHPDNSCDHMGNSFKKSKGELGKEWPEAATRTLRELCQQKIEWTLNDAGITHRSRITNIDETCCKMLPLLECGWLAEDEQHVVMGARRNITVFLATRHLVPDGNARLIFQGKTSAVEPANPYPRLLTTSHSEITGRRRRPSQPSSCGWTPLS